MWKYERIFDGTRISRISGDQKKGKLRIVFGLLCVADGCPVADQGLRTEARIEAELQPLAEEGLEWITALRARVVRALVALVESGGLQLSLFD